MKLTITSIFLFISIFIQAQTVTVLDKNSLQPLTGVAVTNNENNKSATTDAKGTADISTFKNEGIIIFRLLGYSDVSYSWEQVENAKFQVYLSQRLFDLDGAVVSANRFEEKRSEVPQQIATLNTQQLEQLNASSTGDVIQNSGLAVVQKSQQGGGSPMLRGFEANRVLMVIDGVRMNNAIYRAGHLQNIITVDNAGLEKVEVLFGPGSVIYGSDALGGVMSFYTKNPIVSTTDKVGVNGSALARYATTNNEFTGHFDFNVGCKKLASMTSVTYSTFGDLRQGANRNPFNGDTWKREYYQDRIDGVDTMMKNDNINIQKASGYQQYDIMEKLLFKQSDKVSHLLNVQFSNSSDIPRYDRLTDLKSNGDFNSAEWYYGPQQRLMAAYNLQLKTKCALFDDANVILAFQDIIESRHSRGWGSSNLTHRNEHVQVGSLNADFRKKAGKNEISYGLELTNNKVTSTAEKENVNTGEISTADTRYPDGGSTMMTAALYISDYIEVGKKITVAAGIRFTSNNLQSNFDSKEFYPFPYDEVTQKSFAPAGNLGLVYRPGKDWNVALNFATGFRTPNLDDMTKVFASTAGDVVVPNPDLKPEYTYNGELKITKTCNQKITVEGDAYYTLIKNVITLQPTTFNGSDSIDYDGTLSRVLTSENTDEGYIYGGYLGLTAEVTSAFSITSTVNYTYGRVKTDTVDYPLDHIPPVFGKTSLNLHVKKFSGEISALYNGWKRLDDYSLIGEDNIAYATEYGMPAWFSLNVKAGYRICKQLQVQAALENILDQNYRVFGSGISAPGRNFVLTLRGNF